MPDDIRFTPEGGFEWRGPGPNPFTPPPPRVLFNYRDVSRNLNTWGLYGTSMHAVISSLPQGFTRADTGTLLRIAEAVEQLAQQSILASQYLRNLMTQMKDLHDLVLTAAQPALKLVRDYQDRDAALVRERFRGLLTPLEQKHGPCPDGLREDLFKAFLEVNGLANIFLRANLHVHDFQVLDLGSPLEPDTWKIPDPPGRKGSKVRKAWVEWTGKPNNGA